MNIFIVLELNSFLVPIAVIAMQPSNGVVWTILTRLSVRKPVLPVTAASIVSHQFLAQVLLPAVLLLLPLDVMNHVLSSAAHFAEFYTNLD